MAMSSASQSSPAGTTVQEFSIRVPKTSRKRFHVMRFNSVLNIDFSKWGQVKMERENNQKEFSRPDDDMPKFGAGSEFGREAREEARRKKFGIISKKYKPEDQPWILKAGGKTGKKFKGIREGGVGENAAYYVFTHAADGAIDAYPLCEWYNFQPINRYKSLSAEEAEQEFGRRNKVINYFSLMLRKRLRNEEDGELDEEEGKTKRGGGKKSKEFKISDMDMDDWMNSDDESSDEDEAEDDEAKEKKADKKKQNAKKKKNNLKLKKKKKAGSDDSAVEESDDGDEEGRELDYISDSSDSDSDHEAKIDKDMKGVAEESALRQLLSSGEEDEDEEKDEKKKSDIDDNADEEKEKASKKKKKKTVKKEKDDKEANKSKTDKNNDSSSESSAETTDSEVDNKAKLQLNSASSSRCASPAAPSDSKRPATSHEGSVKKKPRLEPLPINFSSSDTGITEDAVKRYLQRKPMTATELLQKFKSKKTGLSSEQLVNVISQLLKKINPVKQTIKGKMFLSLKPPPPVSAPFI